MDLVNKLSVDPECHEQMLDAGIISRLLSLLSPRTIVKKVEEVQCRSEEGYINNHISP